MTTLDEVKELLETRATEETLQEIKGLLDGKLTTVENNFSKLRNLVVYRSLTDLGLSKDDIKNGKRISDIINAMEPFSILYLDIGDQNDPLYNISIIGCSILKIEKMDNKTALISCYNLERTEGRTSPRVFVSRYTGGTTGSWGEVTVSRGPFQIPEPEKIYS